MLELERTPGAVAVSGHTGAGDNVARCDIIPTPAPIMHVLEIYLGGVDPRVVLAAWRRWGRPVVDLGGGRLNNDLKAYLGGLNHLNLVDEWPHVARLGDWYATELKKRGNRVPGAQKQTHKPYGLGKTGDAATMRMDKDNAKHLAQIAGGRP